MSQKCIVTLMDAEVKWPRSANIASVPVDAMKL